jgi:two-component system sensor histidine kinase KdpD
VLVAVGAPLAATALALLLAPDSALGAVPLYLLGVVAAAAVGGMWAGIGSSLLGFLSLNYFFTAPRHTFRVAHEEDVVALAVFLIVAVVVGWLFAKVLEARGRAERREREARLLGYLATKVLSGEPLARVLDDFAGALLDPLRLARCEIHARVGDASFDVVREHAGSEGGATTSTVLRAGPSELGTVTAVRLAGLEPLVSEDLGLFEAAAGQIAVTLERAKLDEQVARARTEAERDQARAALFSSVTHDLRTPLASIKAGVTSLLQQEVPMSQSQREELLSTVLEETDRLNRLVGNLLDLARVRAGALTPAKELTAMDEVVESVLHRMEATLRGVRVRTILRDAPELPVDPVQVDQVLTNILENAARYSPPGGEVLVTVSPWHGAVQVRVSDQGPGVPPEDRERIFEAFYRGGAATGAGSGLGLAIARAIVLGHGGRIWVEGAPGGGTAVVFELPVADAEPVPQEPVP